MSRTIRTTLVTLLAAFSGIVASAQIQVQLPSGPLTRTTTPSVNIVGTNTAQATFFTVTFSGMPAGSSLANTSYTGWCPDFFGDFGQNNSSTPYTPYSTYASNLPVNSQSPNWPAVNWLLNHEPTGAQSTWMVQQVIWRLLANQYGPAAQGFPLPQPATDNLYNQAITQGANYVPAPGQLMGIMLYIDGIYPSSAADIAANPNLPKNGQTNVFQEILVQVPVPNQGAIGDYVWQDTNQNGVQDAGEPGINGVTVKLCPDFACSTVLATTTTVTRQGLNGYYQFTNLGAGTYYVSIDNSQPALTGLVPTQTGQGTPATDSNPNPSQVILATNTSVDETIDFGYTSPGTSAIGDFVWNDSNGNGLQDAGEPGIPGVTVNLCRDAACSTIIATTTTDQNGAYHFTGLLAGTYYVAIDAGTLPPNFVASPSQVGFPGNAAIDSNGSPATVILPENFTDNTIDFGFVPPAQGAIGDYVWHDLNRNGIQDNDSNNNPEPGINNVTVSLYNSSNTLIGTTATVTNSGHDGYYQFTGLAAGTYTVVVDSTTLPPGYTPTTSNAAGSTTANDSNGSPATVTLATNSSVDETIDFGYVTPCVGAIGDFVWNDANQNGIQDVNELGIPGVMVFLRDTSNNLIGSTTTDANGAYHFTGLCAATYSVQVATPAGYQPTASSAPGSTPANDSNGSPATVVLGVDATDNTIDFGFYQPLSVNGQCLAGVNSGEVGVPFNSSTPTVTGGMAPYTFSVVGTLPMGLTLDATTGIITGTPLAPGTWTLQVTDANNTVIALQCPYTVVAAPAVTCSSVTSGEVGVPFNSPAPTVTGGVAPFTFSIVGTLPMGLTLNADGSITGLPTATGTFSLQVTDASQVVAATTCPYTIVGIPTVTCAATTSGEVGVPFNSGAMTVTGGIGPYTYTVVGTLPMGLTLNADGSVSGTPLAAGTFTIQVKDSNGVLASTTCPITIVPGPTVTCAATTSGEVGVPFNSGTMTVTGGVGPYTYTVVGTLPMGLTLNQADGSVSGTPGAAGTFSIQVKDSNGIVATTTCPITIVPGPTVTCAATTSGEVGVPFNSGTMTVTGGVGPYTYTVVGTLPMGLTLNADGSVSGTPSTAGTFSIQVKDSNGIVATTTCPITIVPGPTVTCAATTSGEVGVAFNSGAMTVTGGVGPYTYTVIGTLPTGLAVNPSNGAVTGTPSTAGTFSIQVKDANGVIATTTCPITIVPGPTVTCAATTSGEVGVPFNSGTMTVTGGVGPYTYTVIGTLPTGLAVNPSNGAVTGTPSTAGTFSIQVKDSNGVIATTTCPITIVPGPTVTCAATTSGEVGVAFNSGAMTVTGGVGPYTYTVIGTLPTGLAVNPSNGAVTGTPSTAGTFSIQVKDSNGVIATTTCPITIVPGPTVTCAATTSGEVGVPFNSGAMTVTGGVGPYTYTVIGTLPTGLTLNPSNGAITGTPQAAGTFSIQVRDASGVIATTTCPITIVPGLSVTCSSTNTGTVGVPFNSGAMTVTGGTMPYTFSIGSGTLPSGLTLNPLTGAVTGTPTAPGTFTIKVTDAKGAVGSACTITINPAPNPPSVTCPTGTGQVGVPYNSTVPVTGGSGSYTFSVSAGSLPSGLTLNASTGAITGTPTAAGTSGFTIKVVDKVTGLIGYSSCTSSCSGGGSVINVNMDTVLGSLGNSHVYSVNGVSLTAYGFNNNGTPTAIYGKNQGSTEQGLGIDSDSDNEINTSTFIQLDVSQLVAAGYTNAQISFSSVQAGESWIMYGSNTLGSLGTKLSGLGTLQGTLTAMLGYGTYKYIGITAGYANIDIQALAFTSPGTNCSITITAVPLSVQCPTGAGQVGVAYNSTVPVTGGSGSFTFSVSAGSLPGGLSLNTSTGAITGTPTSAGTSGFTIKVVDKVTGAVAYSNCTSSCSGGGSVVNINMDSALGNLGTTQTYSVNGTSFTAYGFNKTGTPTNLYGKNESSTEQGLGIDSDSDNEINTSTFIQLDVSQLVAAGYTNAQISFSSVQAGESWIIYGSNTLGSLGTKLSGSGTLQGTLTAMLGYGTYKYIGITAGYANIDIQALAFTAPGTSCSITVTAAPLTVTCGSTSTGTIGTYFNSGSIGVTGGVAPYTFSVVGTLPSGLTLNTSTGAVTGTPKAAGTFSIAVTDSKGKTTTSCTITITPPQNPHVTCGTNNAGTVGVPFNSGPVNISGGTGPYTFTVVGKLPAGLTLNTSTGAVTGTPTQSGTFSIQATDSKGNLGSCQDNQGNPVGNSCAITINPAPVPPVTVTCGTNNTGTVGVYFSSGAITVTGGVAPYTFTVVGNLPNGLSLNSSTGAVTGTPTQSGTFSIQATDTKGNVGSCSDSKGNPVGSACSITINPSSNSNTVVSPGDAATIGFWHNQNGQALIDSLNGGVYSHTLANMLASQAPYLYGSKSSNDLTGGNNGDVAALFLTFFNQSGQKTQAQILASALACYVTSSSLAGTNAVQYGFNSSSNGTCTQTYNVGSNGSAIGLSNNQSYTVLQLLQLANQEVANGTFNADANTFNTIFSGINQTGDIN